MSVQGARASRLERLVDQVLEHRLADLEALIILDTLRRWPEEAFGYDSIIRLDAASVGRRLRVCSVAVHRAIKRLVRRGLVLEEFVKGRRHVRLTTTLWMIATSIDADDGMTLRDAQTAAVAAGPRSGRDRVLLMVLLARASPGSNVVRVRGDDLAEVTGMTRRSIRRIVSRLVSSGAVTRVRGGLVLHALPPTQGATQG